MDSNQFRELQNTIAESIEKNVNGKIRALDAKVDNYIKIDLEHKEYERAETTEWRKGADEKLQFVVDLQGFGKVTKYVMGFIVSLGGAVAIILGWLHNKNN